MANVALLATIADAKASQATQTVSPVMPTGVILPYGGNTAPEGWLVCDGAEYSQTTYADLFAALGSTYNTQLNPVTGSNWAAPSGGNFRVPDMRGMFLRGEGTPSGLDAVSVGGTQVDKTKKNALSATSSTPTVSGTTNIAHSHGASSLSVNNTNLNHGHSITTGNGNGRIYTEYFGPASQCRFVGSVGPYQGSAEAYAEGNLGDHAHSGTAAGQSLGTTSPSLSGTVSQPTITIAGGDNETRPMNRGVKYIIKV